VECFGAVVSEASANQWRSSAVQEQVIGQAELAPVLVARLTWAERLRNRKVLYFVDNESARLALVRAYSPVLASLEFVLRCHNFDAEWDARAPSPSNIGDAPSRMKVSKDLVALEARVVKPVCPRACAYVKSWSRGIAVVRTPDCSPP